MISHDAEMFKGIIVLYQDSRRLVKGEWLDLIAERGAVACAQAVTAALRAEGMHAIPVPVRGDVEIELADFPPSEWIVFNLVDGLEGRLFEEARVAWVLEAKGYCFTGTHGDALALTTDKARTKALLQSRRIPTPSWWVFSHPDAVDKSGMSQGDLPVIVKPVAEDGSIGVRYPSVAQTLPAVKDRVAYIIETYRQAALVERFVVGREFNVALWDEPAQVLPLAEIDFDAFENVYERIVSYEAKWEEGTFAYAHTPARFREDLPAELCQAITRTALNAWKVVGGQGYGRVDMRLSEENVPYVIEVNCNPDISPDAGFFHAVRQAGMTYQEMIRRIVAIAMKGREAYDRTGASIRRFKHPLDHADGRRVQPYRSPVRARVVGRVSE